MLWNEDEKPYQHQAARDYSSALYCDPPSHDFCVWLIIAELMRRYHDTPGPLKVRFALRNGMLGYLDFGPYSLREAHQDAQIRQLKELVAQQNKALNELKNVVVQQHNALNEQLARRTSA